MRAAVIVIAISILPVQRSARDGRFPGSGYERGPMPYGTSLHFVDTQVITMRRATVLIRKADLGRAHEANAMGPSIVSGFPARANFHQ
jgi:hypothetical protein